MKTIALRFGETFSPPCGTIIAHQRIIDKLGYICYGKHGKGFGRQAARSDGNSFGSQRLNRKMLKYYSLIVAKQIVIGLI